MWAGEIGILAQWTGRGGCQIRARLYVQLDGCFAASPGMSVHTYGYAPIRTPAKQIVCPRLQQRW